MGFSIRVFGVFRGSCLATFNEKPECEERFGFFDASVNGTTLDSLVNVTAVFEISKKKIVNCSGWAEEGIF